MFDLQRFRMAVGTYKTTQRGPGNVVWHHVISFRGFYRREIDRQDRAGTLVS
jgi:hypothetical protein